MFLQWIYISRRTHHQLIWLFPRWLWSFVSNLTLLTYLCLIPDLWNLIALGEALSSLDISKSWEFFSQICAASCACNLAICICCCRQAAVKILLNSGWDVEANDAMHTSTSQEKSSFTAFFEEQGDFQIWILCEKAGTEYWFEVFMVFREERSKMIAMCGQGPVWTRPGTWGKGESRWALWSTCPCVNRRENGGQ